MASKPRVLIDLNIILDVLQKREPFFESSRQLLSAAETGVIHGFVAAHSITTLFYLIKKDKTVADARAIITSLLQFLEVVPVQQNTIEQALNLDFRDFEDAVQMISAVQAKMDYLVTRNTKDYQPEMLPVFDPVDFVASLNT